MKYLRMFFNLGYVRLAIMILAFHWVVKSLAGRPTFDRTMLIEDLRSAANQLGRIPTQSKLPFTLASMREQGIISGDLLERCEEAKVFYHPENVGNSDNLPIFTVPNQEKGRNTLVTSAGSAFNR
jgi:hypothetical protein